MELDHIGGTFGGNRKPTPFMYLVMKMLQIHQNGVGSASGRKTHVGLIQDKQALMMQRVSHLLTGNRSPENQFNDPSSSDIKLTLSSKDGFSVSMNLHRQILVAHSRFFAVKLLERWVKQQRTAVQQPSISAFLQLQTCRSAILYKKKKRLLSVHGSVTSSSLP